MELYNDMGTPEEYAARLFEVSPSDLLAEGEDRLGRQLKKLFEQTRDLEQDSIAFTRY